MFSVVDTHAARCQKMVNEAMIEVKVELLKRLLRYTPRLPERPIVVTLDHLQFFVVVEYTVPSCVV